MSNLAAFYRWLLRQSSSPRIESADDPARAIPAVVVEIATMKSIPPGPIIAITIPKPVNKQYPPRASSIPTAIPGIVTIYKPPFAEAVIPLATVPLTIIPLATVAAPALIAEGCSRYCQ